MTMTTIYLRLPRRQWAANHLRSAVKWLLRGRLSLAWFHLGQARHHWRRA